MTWHAPFSIALCTTILIGSDARANGFGATLRLTADAVHTASAGFYAVPSAFLPVNERSTKQNLELNGQKNGFNFTATLSNRAFRGSKSKHAQFFNELYYDTQLAGQEISIGRKITSWGVGFGFRPLDVIQQENRRSLYQNTLKGVNLLAWEKFGETSALSVVWSNPGRSEVTEPTLDQSVAVRYFNSLNSTDLHTLARYSKRTGTQLGLGLSKIVGDAVEWHASLLWQRHYHKNLNSLARHQSPVLLSQTDPFIEQAFNNALEALVRMSWTHSSGWGVLGEIWYYQTAYNDHQWRALNALTAQQRGLLGAAEIPDDAVYGNIAWNRQAYLQRNLRQWNMLLRISRQGAAFEPSLELLYNPEDGGLVTTGRLGYISDWQQFEVGLRRFGGTDGSVWSQMPDDGQVYLSWRVNF